MDQRTPGRTVQREALMSAWRRAAIQLLRTNPTWTRVEVALVIQRSPLGRKELRALPYSLNYIMLAFKGLRFRRRWPTA